jgi:exonuclease SbcD
MKFIHTSDWHLGHMLYGFDRTVEQWAMLEQMVQIVREHKPDVFLISGDVYHTSQPSAAVQTLFSDAMVSLHQAHPEMYIVVIAGNHDSASKHEIFTTPWKALHVYAIGNLYKDNLENHMVEVPGKGYVLAVPYAYRRNIPDGFFQDLIDNVKSNLPIVLMAHTTVKGADFTGHDTKYDDQIGGIDYVEVEKMGEGYDYLALGHIHKAQYIHTGNHNVRYSGTPIPISFDENYPHTVSLVEVEKGKTPQLKEIEIHNPYQLVTLPKEGYATWEDVKDLLREFPDDVQAYVRLNILIEGFPPVNALDEARQIAENKACRVCYIHSKQINESAEVGETLTVQQLQQMSPLEIASNYAATQGVVFSEEMIDMFKEVLALTEIDENEEK